MPSPSIQPTSIQRGALGSYLWDTRNALGMSLREAEEASGVSNAYINQIETGRIKAPSPAILQKIAVGYKAPYQHLMELAGHLKASTGGETKRRGALPTSTLADVELTREEEEKVREYIAFLKMKNRRTDENG